MVLVLVIGGRSSGHDPLRLIMVGIAIGYAMNAATGFLIFASDSPEASRSVMFWMMGIARQHSLGNGLGLDLCGHCYIVPS